MYDTLPQSRMTQLRRMWWYFDEIVTILRNKVIFLILLYVQKIG